MAWLIACPHHYLGLGGLVFFMVVFYFQPQIKRVATLCFNMLLATESLVLLSLSAMFYLAMVYGASYLPYGKFFNRIGGNVATLASFSYALVYLSLPFSIFMGRVNSYFFKKINVS